MNLKEDILKALEGKGYDDFAKIRWIYLYVCEMFSYDTRFYYGNQKMKTNIYNIDIDITNVQEYEIICYTISRVLADILNEIGYEAIVVRESNNLFSHAYVEVRHHDYVLKLDPTKRHDITRMKMNSTTPSRPVRIWCAAILGVQALRVWWSELVTSPQWEESAEFSIFYFNFSISLAAANCFSVTSMPPMILAISAVLSSPVISLTELSVLPSVSDFSISRWHPAMDAI